jgi:hypothetical protein
MKRFIIDWKVVKSDALGYMTELGWMILYTIALFIMTWIISVIPW